MAKTSQNYSSNLVNYKLSNSRKNHTLHSERFNSSETIHPRHIKRFLERWLADSNFRREISINPSDAINRYNFKIDIQEIKALTEKNISENSLEIAKVLANLNQRSKCTEQIEALKSIKSIAAASSNSKYKAWRERQISRTTSQFKKETQDAIMHAPVCFELSKGCSIGCWFCGVSAPRLGDIFLYNSENTQFWRKIQELLKDILGLSAGAGFCYWASDPLDNPDYEKFCLDFYETFGLFPQTTTAQPLKDVSRTRSLLKLSRERSCPLNRFSILSLNMLEQVYKEFDVEELAFVDLVLQNKEAKKIKANSGRVRERNISRGEEDDEFPEQGTIACVSGFLFNMVDRSVKLISPCNANERWPLGYITYDEGTFDDIDELKDLLERMIRDNMSLTIKPNDVINFRRDLRYESFEDGFQLTTKFKTFKFKHDFSLRELGSIIHKGNRTAREIVSILEQNNISSAFTNYYLNLMFEKGVLDDEPKLK